MRSCLGKKKNWKKEYEIDFKSNSGKTLKEMIGYCSGRYNPLRYFSAKVLKIATRNYDEQQVFQNNGLSKLYKGFLRECPLSIKKFRDNSLPYKNVLDEIEAASRMGVHKNVLKLLGCCVETQIPILVFEYAENGTLADRLYGSKSNNPHFQPLLWECRLRIAMDIANVIAYLHTAFANPIIHRDIKPANFLLDEHYVAKLSDFSLAIYIPDGKSEVEDAVRGTIGFISPEYLATGIVTEKHDVFSFGVLLLQLLTGQKAFDLAHLDTDENVTLVDHVKYNIEHNSLNEIVDPIMTKGEGLWPGKDQQQLSTFTSLALTCISPSPGDRPTMVDVAKELSRIDQSVSRPC